MKIKTTLAVIALFLAPTLAVAEGCMHDRMDEAKLSCAPGTVLDEKTGTCVMTTS